MNGAKPRTDSTCHCFRREGAGPGRVTPFHVPRCSTSARDSAKMSRYPRAQVQVDVNVARVSFVRVARFFVAFSILTVMPLALVFFHCTGAVEKYPPPPFYAFRL